MSVPVYRHVTNSANQMNDTSVYRHAVCNCEQHGSLTLLHAGTSKDRGRSDRASESNTCT